MKKMKTIALFIAFLLCLVYIPVEAKTDLTKEPIRFVKRAPPAPAPHVPPASAPQVPPAKPVTPVGEDDDDKDVSIVPDAKGKKDLRTMVESLVSLVNGLRKNGTIRLPDPIEREFKSIVEALEKLQDYLKTDLDIDMGNILNSGGK